MNINLSIHLLIALLAAWLMNGITLCAQEAPFNGSAPPDASFKPKTDHRIDLGYVAAPRVPYELRYRYVRQTNYNRFWAYGLSLGYEWIRHREENKLPCTQSNPNGPTVRLQGYFDVIQAIPTVSYLQNLYYDDVSNTFQWYLSLQLPIARRWAKTVSQQRMAGECVYDNLDWEYTNLVSFNGYNDDFDNRSSVDLGCWLAAGLEFKLYWRIYGGFEVRGGLLHRWIQPSRYYMHGQLAGELGAKTDTRSDQSLGASIRLGVRI